MKTLRFYIYIFMASALLISMMACSKATPVSYGDPGPVETATKTLIPLQPGDSQRTLTVNGLERTYLLHVPYGLATGKFIPLVFVFHGLSENASLIQQASGFNDIADKNGFIVVYPNGSGPSGSLSWNAGKCCGSAQVNAVDEAAFIRQIIVDLNTTTKIDRIRTYATGFSNGALLAYRLACEMSDTFAAVAPVAGALITDPCQPAQPVSVIHFQGLSDIVVPYGGGGTIPGTNQAFPPTEQSIATWVRLDECTVSPKVEQTVILTHTVHASCKNGTAVELYAVKGIGHSWPSQYVVPASQIIWDFFAAHPKL